MTHGMAAEKEVHEDEKPLIDERLRQFLDELKPEGAYQTFLVERIAAAAARIDWCERQEDAWRYRQEERAELNWDGDRQVAILELAEGLGERPEIVAAQLRQSLHGADWLIRKFRVLAGILAPMIAAEASIASATTSGAAPGSAPVGTGLDAANREWACNLLGLSPEERLSPGPLDPPAGSTQSVAAHQAALIAKEIAALEQRKTEVLAELDATDRTAAAMDSGPAIDATLRLIFRYQSEAERRRTRAYDELRTLQREAASACEEAQRRKAQEEEKARESRAKAFIGDLLARRRAAAAGAEVAPPPAQAAPDAAALAAEPPAENHSATTPASVASAPAPAVAMAVAVASTPASAPAPVAGRPAGLATLFATARPRNRRERRAEARRAAHLVAGPRK